MDRIFDEMARVLASPMPRRKAFRFIGGGGSAAVVGAVTVGSGSAAGVGGAFSVQPASAACGTGQSTCGKGGNQTCCNANQCCATNGAAGARCCNQGQCYCSNGTCAASSGGSCPGG